MHIKDLTKSQLNLLFCSAMGWHSQLSTIDDEYSVEEFDKFCEQNLNYEWEENIWNIRSDKVQIEIREDLYFRCGHIVGTAIGGTAFDLKAVCKCLKEFGFEL